jgi:hypothetical protein
MNYRIGILSGAALLSVLALSCAVASSPQPTSEVRSAQNTQQAAQSSAQTSLVPQQAPAQPAAAQTGTIMPAAQPAPTASGAALWPLGTATPPEQCALCHAAIYREYALGLGADMQVKGIVAQSAQEPLLQLPPEYPVTSTAHAYAGVDPWPIRARQIEEGGKSCNVCHYPQAFNLPAFDTQSVAKPQPRELSQEAPGITCASCHLTPDGKMRGPYDLPQAPHATVQDPAMQSSAACEFCHSMGPRVVGKQTQTFLEWRDDFNKAGLGPQQCQDCHMPRTVRKLSENYDVPARPVAAHLWTGSHSPQRLASALHLGINAPQAGRAAFEFHVRNIGAGHSVPTGSNRRAVYLSVNVLDQAGNVLASPEWMFAPSFADRPDDKAFVEADKSGPEPVAATQADAQGPHEAPIRAGEDRVLTWETLLKPGAYTLRATLIYDLNRYNDRAFTDDQTEMGRASLSVTIQ